MILDRARFPLWLAAAFAVLVALVAWSLSVGRFPVAPGDVWKALWSVLSGAGSYFQTPPNWSSGAADSTFAFSTCFAMGISPR